MFLKNFIIRLTKHNKRGFSLIESLLSLSLFLFILLSSLEFFISTRNHFFNLKDEQEIDLAAYSTLDKIRLDLCECGRGLIVPQSMELFEAIQLTDGILVIHSKDKEILPESDLVAGQTFIQVVSTAGIKKGQKLCFTDLEKGEVKTIAAVDKHGLTLGSSLNYSYRKDEAAFILIRTLSFFLDSSRGILRRKVNASPAQPLLENVSAFNVFYEAKSNIVSLSLILKKREDKEYETFFFPKNMALVPRQ
jgi:type II secretory pathway pseudopilin PulG